MAVAQIVKLSEEAEQIDVYLDKIMPLLEELSAESEISNSNSGANASI